MSVASIGVCLIPICSFLSGTLERHETGEMAKAILIACDDFAIDMNDSVVTSSHETQRHSRTTFKSSNSHKLGALSHHLIHPEKSSNKVRKQYILLSS